MTQRFVGAVVVASFVLVVARLLAEFAVIGDRVLYVVGSLWAAGVLVTLYLLVVEVEEVEV